MQDSQLFDRRISKLNYVILLIWTHFNVKTMENRNAIQKLYRRFWDENWSPHSEPLAAESMSQSRFWARLCLHRKTSMLGICLFFMLRKVILAHLCPGKTFQLGKMTLRSYFLLLLFIWLSANRGCQKKGRDWYYAKSKSEGKETSSME